MTIIRTAARPMSSAIVGWDIVFEDPVHILRFVFEDAWRRPGLQRVQACPHSCLSQGQKASHCLAWSASNGKGIEHVDLAVCCRKRTNQTHERDKKQRMTQNGARECLWRRRSMGNFKLWSQRLSLETLLQTDQGPCELKRSLFKRISLVVTEARRHQG